MLFTGILVGIIISIVAISFVAPKLMFVEKESKLSFDDTILALEKSIKEHQWSMPHQYDLKATMQKHGFEVKPVKVFSVCKPEHAYQILNKNKERAASALMPCRISVYERDGKTYISLLNAGLFSRLMSPSVKGIMAQAAAENEEIIRAVIK